MQKLDNVKSLQELDGSNMYGSVEALSKQCMHAWEALKDFSVPESYTKVNKVIMAGMGGSGLAARIIESVFGLQLQVPLIHIHDYDLPAWADEHTLVLCSAFSGETEEPVQIARQAQERGCQWMSIGAGGTIIKFAQQHNRPYYQIDPVHNPSKQPRMANGYSVVGQLIMASKTGLFSISQKDIDTVMKTMQSVVQENTINVPTDKNPAKQQATAIHQKVFVLVAARHLMGAIHLIKNQANENAKNFAVLFDIPEMNHHLLEGLKYPDSNINNLHVFFAESDLYPERIQKRFSITQEILNTYGIHYTVWKATSGDTFSQAFECVQFGSFVNHYLAMLNGLDPATIPYVDYFKVQLGQPLGDLK